MDWLKEVNQKALKFFESGEWVKWVHEGTKPAYTNAEKTANIAFSKSIMGKHCSICLNLNGCCFPKNNMPQYPLHPNCHCKIERIGQVRAKSICALIKFSKYIFNENATKNEGKKALFESWGYAIIDSAWLHKEFIRQAQEKYSNGNFMLGKLDRYGQRISIEIILPRKDKIGTIKFISGGMVYPSGVIQNTTPYGG